MALKTLRDSETWILLNRQETIKVAEKQLGRKLHENELDYLENGEILVNPGKENAMNLMLSQLGITIMSASAQTGDPRRN